MKRTSAALLLPLLSFLSACGSGRGDGTPAVDQLALPSGIPASQLPEPNGQGARLVARYCSSCHGIPSPESHSAEDWVSTTRRMFLRIDRAGHMGGGMMGGRGRRGGMGRVPAPSPSEERGILAYLQSHALAVAKPGALPDAGSDAEALFSRSCSRCHALPDPSLHTPDEWPAVVARMRGHMRDVQVGDLSDADAKAVVEYLQRASGGGS